MAAASACLSLLNCNRALRSTMARTTQAPPASSLFLLQRTHPTSPLHSTRARLCCLQTHGLKSRHQALGSSSGTRRRMWLNCQARCRASRSRKFRAARVVHRAPQVVFVPRKAHAHAFPASQAHPASRASQASSEPNVRHAPTIALSATMGLAVQLHA